MIRHELAQQVGRIQSFDTFELRKGTEPSFQAAKRLAEGDKDALPWLVLLGSTGNGKTHLCHAIELAASRRGVGVWCQNVTAFFSDYRASIKAKDADEYLLRAKSIAMLILDDYGSERGTDWETTSLQEILDHRYDRMLDTVVASNLKMDDFPERLRSRFSDRQRCLVVVNRAPDYRPGKTRGG